MVDVRNAPHREDRPALLAAYNRPLLSLLPTMNGNGLGYPVLQVGWTLIFEMFFYATVTASLFLKASYFRTVLWLFLPLSAVGLFRTPGWPVFLTYADPIILEFLAGVIVARLTMRGFSVSPLAGSVLAMAGIAFFFLPVPPDSSPVMRPIYNGIPAVLFLIAMLSFDTILRKRAFRIFAVLGDASYSIYLVHILALPAIAMAAVRFGLARWIGPQEMLGLSIAMVCAISVLLFHGFELPVQKYLTRSLRRTPRKPAAR